MKTAILLFLTTCARAGVMTYGLNQNPTLLTATVSSLTVTNQSLLTGTTVLNGLDFVPSAAPTAAKGEVYFDSSLGGLEVSLNGSTFVGLSTGAVGNFVNLQSATPGSQQSGNLNISGTGIIPTISGATAFTSGGVTISTSATSVNPNFYSGSTAIKIGIGTTNPSGWLSNTATDIVSASGFGQNGEGINWAYGNNGHVLGIYNGSSGSNSQGIVIQSRGGTGNQLEIDSTTAQGNTGTALFVVKGNNGNTGIGSGASAAGSQLTIVGGGVNFYSRSIAQLLAISPVLGDTYFCNTCSPLKIVIGTGTSAGNFADPAGGTFK